MNHAVTVGGILAVLMGLAGLLCLGFGALAVFAGGMSDAPQAGDDASRTGCIVLGIGAALIALSIWIIA